MDEVSIRPASEDDLEVVTALEAAVYQFPGARPWNFDQFRSEFDKPYSRIWVLTDDETDSKLFGYIVMSVLNQEMQILNLAVHPDHRGLGFAKQMVRKAVSTALEEEHKRVFLEVRKSNNAAVQLYQALRFDITHIRKGFYENGEDAYQMEIDLEGELAKHGAKA